MRKISIETVRAAVPRVYPVVTRTPLVRLDPLSRTSPEIFLKLEVFQPIGSFKIRGAMNAVAQLTPAQMAEGVWTVSAGNAAQGVALAAREAGTRASVMRTEINMVVLEESAEVTGPRQQMLVKIATRR